MHKAVAEEVVVVLQMVRFLKDLFRQMSANTLDSWEEEYMSHFTLSRHMSWSCTRLTAVVQVSREPRHPSTRADCRCRSNDLRAPRSTETVHTTPTRQSSVCCYRSCLS
ncbi:hypothetical protein J6590_065145 [Homalodisca vitripennis]|nr:hypothetical protein J6590_065145 [Homalodisca vitripennis]